MITAICFTWPYCLKNSGFRLLLLSKKTKMLSIHATFWKSQNLIPSKKNHSVPIAKISSCKTHKIAIPQKLTPSKISCLTRAPELEGPFSRQSVFPFIMLIWQLCLCFNRLWSSSQVAEIFLLLTATGSVIFILWRIIDLINRLVYKP